MKIKHKGNMKNNAVKNNKMNLDRNLYSQYFDMSSYQKDYCDYTLSWDYNLTTDEQFNVSQSIMDYLMGGSKMGWTIPNDMVDLDIFNKNGKVVGEMYVKFNPINKTCHLIVHADTVS